MTFTEVLVETVVVHTHTHTHSSKQSNRERQCLSCFVPSATPAPSVDQGTCAPSRRLARLQRYQYCGKRATAAAAATEARQTQKRADQRCMLR